MKRLVWGFVAVTTVLAVGIFTLAYALVPRISVTLVNKTGAQLQNVTLQYTGGQVVLGPIEPDGVARAKIRVSGESSIRVTHLDTKGVKHESDAGLYIESGYRGSVTIDVTPSGAVVRSQQIKSY